jgi:hypothetical protein
VLTSRDVRPTGIPVVIIYNRLELHNDFVRKMRRMDHRFFLKLEKDKPMLMLKHSLIFDGRFYGAEWMED